MKINFPRGVGGSLSYFVEVPEGWEGWEGWGSSVPCNMENQGGVGGGGILSEIPSVVGYGYFLKPHNMRSVC